MEKITLQPVAMRKPNKLCVYQKSRLSNEKTISKSEFQERFSPHRIKVAMGDDITKWEWMEAWSNGLDCWYVMTHGVAEPEPSRYEPGFNRDAQGNWFIYTGATVSQERE